MIGATSGTGSITVSGTFNAFLAGIYDGSTGTNSIAYNTIGAISQSATGSYIVGILVNSTSTTTVDHNTIGNSTASNMANSADKFTYAIYFGSTGTYTTTNNTIQNFSLTGGNTATVFFGIISNSTGTLNCQNNTISAITSNGTSTTSGSIISIFGGSGHTVNGNTITALNV